MPQAVWMLLSYQAQQDGIVAITVDGYEGLTTENIYWNLLLIKQNMKFLLYPMKRKLKQEILFTG